MIGIHQGTRELTSCSARALLLDQTQALRAKKKGREVGKDAKADHLRPSLNDPPMILVDAKDMLVVPLKRQTLGGSIHNIRRKAHKVYISQKGQ